MGVSFLCAVWADPVTAEPSGFGSFTGCRCWKGAAIAVCRHSWRREAELLGIKWWVVASVTSDAEKIAERVHRLHGHQQAVGNFRGFRLWPFQAYHQIEPALCVVESVLPRKICQV